MRLTVLYMPDGGMDEDFLHVAGLVQVSTGNGTMRPFLLVGIENTERRRNLFILLVFGGTCHITPPFGIFNAH